MFIVLELDIYTSDSSIRLYSELEIMQISRSRKIKQVFVPDLVEQAGFGLRSGGGGVSHVNT